MTTESKPATAIKRLQHVVLHVTDVERSRRFYCDVLGYEVTHEMPGRMAFLRFPGSGNDHDLALSGGHDLAPFNARAAGLGHSAWEVGELTDLIPIRDQLQAAGALQHTRHHGNSLSVYGTDPDGMHFEFFWSLPVPEEGHDGSADLEAEIAKRGMVPAR